MACSYINNNYIRGTETIICSKLQLIGYVHVGTRKVGTRKLGIRKLTEENKDRKSFSFLYK